VTEVNAKFYDGCWTGLGAASPNVAGNFVCDFGRVYLNDVGRWLAGRVVPGNNADELNALRGDFCVD